MTVTAAGPRVKCGMRCARCGEELPLPEWSEYRNDREVDHLWHCWKCDYRFQTIARVASIDDIKIRDDVFPSLLVTEGKRSFSQYHRGGPSYLFGWHWAVIIWNCEGWATLNASATVERYPLLALSRLSNAIDRCSALIACQKPPIDWLTFVFLSDRNGRSAVIVPIKCVHK